MKKLDKKAKLNKVFEGHKYVTRRQLLGAGLIPAAGWIMLPGIAGLLGKMSEGISQTATCSAAAVAARSFPAVITINADGGQALHANYVPVNPGDTPLLDMTAMGLGLNGKGYTPQTIFKNKALYPVPTSAAIVQSIGGIPRGVIQQSGLTFGTNILQNTTFLSVPHVAMDDNLNNPSSIAGMIAADLGNAVLPNMATVDSPTGVNAVYSVLAPPAPLFVPDASAILGALAPAGALNQMSNAQKQSVLRTISNLAPSQASTLNSMAGGSNLANLIQCAANQNVANIQSSGAFDPGSDATVASIWGIQQSNFQSGSLNINGRNTPLSGYTAAAITYNVLKGNALYGSIELGGYDYHLGVGSRGESDAADFTSGQLIGMILRTAAYMNQAVVIDYVTDGSTNCGAGETAAGGDYTSDFGERCSRHLYFFDPSGKTAPATPNTWMIGSFDAEGQASNGVLNNDIPSGALVAFANIMAFVHGSANAATHVQNVVGSSIDITGLVKLA